MRKAAYLGRILRGEKYEVPKLIITGKMEGKREIGRKQHLWMRNLRQGTGISDRDDIPFGQGWGFMWRVQRRRWSPTRLVAFATQRRRRKIGLLNAWEGEEGDGGEVWKFSVFLTLTIDHYFYFLLRMELLDWNKDLIGTLDVPFESFFIWVPLYYTSPPPPPAAWKK